MNDSATAVQEKTRRFIVSVSPHIRSPETIPRIMWTVNACLAPAGIWSIWRFGFRALLVILLSLLTAVITEALIQRFRRIRVTVYDGSAFLTGLLLAYVLPANVPWFIPVIGSFVAVAVAKHTFGGLGNNIWNPALVGRAFILAAYAGYTVMSEWPLLKTGGFFRDLGVGEHLGVEGISRPTPLFSPSTMAEEGYSFSDLFFGNIPGCLGEVSAFLLLLGAGVLLWKKYINWRIPFFFIGAVLILTLILPEKEKEGITPFFSGDIVRHVFGGGLILGAFYMATDMVTTPMTHAGAAVFGLGCGIITSMIRLYGGYPEGVCYSILLMNTATPLIDRFLPYRKFGERKNVS